MKDFYPILNKILNFTLDGFYIDYFYKYLILVIQITDYVLAHLEDV